MRDPLIVRAARRQPDRLAIIATLDDVLSDMSEVESCWAGRVAACVRAEHPFPWANRRGPSGKTARFRRNAHPDSGFQTPDSERVNVRST